MITKIRLVSLEFLNTFFRYRWLWKWATRPRKIHTWQKRNITKNIFELFWWVGFSKLKCLTHFQENWEFLRKSDLRFMSNICVLYQSCFIILFGHGSSEEIYYLHSKKIFTGLPRNKEKSPGKWPYSRVFHFFLVNSDLLQTLAQNWLF